MPSRFLNSIDITGNETISGDEYVTNNSHVGNDLFVDGISVMSDVSASDASFSGSVSAAYFHGDASLLTNVDATKIRGRALADIAPTDGQVLSWSSATSAWEPSVAGGGGPVEGNDIGGRAWSVTSTYTQGDLVATSQRETWICIQSNNTGHDPTTSPLWWQPQPADAISLQLVPVSTTTPANGQVLAYNSTTGKWEPTSLNGSINFNAPGTHSWAVPAWVRWVYVSAAAGTGSDGTATDGQNGNQGAIAYFDENQNPVAATTGSNGADGTASDGIAGKSITVSSLSLNYAGGSAGIAGIPGYGGGGGGGAGISDYRGNIDAANGSAGNGPNPGQGGTGASLSFPTVAGGAGGGDGGAGADSSNGGFGGSAGPNFGGAGGGGGQGQYYGGGGGGGDNHSGGGGGGGGIAGTYSAGYPGSGGKASPSTLGGNGESFVGPKDLSSVAGTTIPIVISEGAGIASISFTY